MNATPETAVAVVSDSSSSGDNEEHVDAAVLVDSFSTDEVSRMIIDKDVSVLQALGGTAGLLEKLDVDPGIGIVPSRSNTAEQTRGSLELKHTSKLSKTNSKTQDLAREVAAVQDDPSLTWLSEFEADRKLYGDRVERYGVNILPPAKTRSFLSLVWEALHDKMLILLIVAAIVSLAIGIYQDVRVTGNTAEDDQNVHWVEGFAIIVAISVVTLVASVNDYQKEKQFRKLNAKKNDRRVRVMRNGLEHLVSTNCIFVGDILSVEPGDILCADAVVISSSNLQCDESSITGESDAIKKSRLEDAERLNAQRKERRRRRRTELRNRRNEQRAYTHRLASTKIDEIETIEPENQSGAEADESTDGEDDYAMRATLSVKAKDAVTTDDKPIASPTQQAPEGGKKRTKSSASKRADPFLVSGSRVTEGVGSCVVVAVGENSFYGSTLMSLRSKNDPTPLQVKLNGMAELIAKLGGAAGLLMFIVLIIKYAVQLGRNETSRNATKVADSIVRIIISAVTVVVVAVPEGLPLAVTLALAVATVRMLKDKCLVRVLASCETMGNATTICSDKTGTLTQNRMTVVAGCIGDQYQFSSYPPGASEEQRRLAKRPPADGLVTDMTGRAVPPEKAVTPTLLETRTRRQNRLRTRRYRQQRRRLSRTGTPEYSSSSALSPLSDTSPSFSGISELSDFSEDEDLVVPTAELGEEAPLAVLNLCHDAIAVNSAAFIPAKEGGEDDANPEDALLGNGRKHKKRPSFWRRAWQLVTFRGKRADANTSASNEETQSESAAAMTSSADKFTGSKTEVAMLSWSETLGAPEYSQLRDKDVDEHIQVWPFSSERKSMSTLVKIRRREDGKEIWRLYVKGAPEVVIQSCRWIVDVDGAFQAQDRDEILNGRATQMSSQHSLAGMGYGYDSDNSNLNGNAPRADIPQINLDLDCDGDNESVDDDNQNFGPVETPYLLTAHYTGSRNAGSDTTEVNEDVMLAASFPGDFSHNPAVPVLSLDDETLYDLRHTVSDYASRALRTIAIAYRDFESFDQAQLAQLELDAEWQHAAGLVCLGIFAIEDPLRDGVTDAVRRCQNAGIVVRMVTGDNMLTARAIATQCGIFTPGMGGIVLEGPKFRKLSPEQMEFIIPRMQVLARSSPEDKRMLVEWLRAHGEVVSVTGDGTNDGPALKAANVGFSMGIAGTEVAKEASSIVLMDDNFTSIVRACLWGRTVNDAVKKFLQFQLTVNVTAVLIAFVSSVVDSQEQSVFTAIQLLWINLIMDTFAALALATDPPHANMLDRYPEKQNSPLITFTMWKNILGQSIFQVVVCFLTLYAADDIFHLHTVTNSHDMTVLRTLVFNTFAWMQIFNEFNCRVLHNEANCFKGLHKNMFFVGILLISVLGQVIIVQWGSVAFQTTALSGKYWAFSIIGGLLSLPVGLVLRLIPDEMIWWMLPFVTQDVYKKPQNIEWQPPAQNLRSRLANDEEPPVNHGGDGAIKTSMAKFGASIRTMGKRRPKAKTNGPPLSPAGGAVLAFADAKTDDKMAGVVNNGNTETATTERQQQSEIGLDSGRVPQQPHTPLVDADTTKNVPRKASTGGLMSRKRSGSGDAKSKSIIAAAMVPSMVASSIGIGMSTSAMPPTNMTIEAMVDKELENRTDDHPSSNPS
ncbi:plasma membrane calcium [Coemansia sp. RSA 1933]|nr:plasma membrane calcium [Coemansia sp. RSA 1933]